MSEKNFVEKNFEGEKFQGVLKFFFEKVNEKLAPKAPRAQKSLISWRRSLLEF